MDVGGPETLRYPGKPRGYPGDPFLLSSKLYVVISFDVAKVHISFNWRILLFFTELNSFGKVRKSVQASLVLRRRNGVLDVVSDYLRTPTLTSFLLRNRPSLTPPLPGLCRPIEGLQTQNLRQSFFTFPFFLFLSVINWYFCSVIGGSSFVSNGFLGRLI